MYIPYLEHGLNQPPISEYVGDVWKAILAGGLDPGCYLPVTTLTGMGSQNAKSILRLVDQELDKKQKYVGEHLEVSAPETRIHQIVVIER